MKRRHYGYTKPAHYSDEQLERFRLADLLNDARCALRHARELEAGANPAHYGMTVAELRAYAELQRSEYRVARGKHLVSCVTDDTPTRHRVDRLSTTASGLSRWPTQGTE